MNTDTTTAPDYGEPWYNEIGDYEIYSPNEGDAVAYAESASRRNRIIACVNACAGMADPAAEINSLKEDVERWKGNARAAKRQRDIIIDEGAAKTGEIDNLNEQLAQARSELAEIAAMRARIAELEAAQEWRPMHDAPRDGTRILGITENGFCDVIYWSKRTNDFVGKWSPFVAWMPLPSRPAAINKALKEEQV